MRYSSALVLSTLAVGQAAAANIRHASFHGRRHAQEKRDASYDNVDWSKVSYDLSGVDWSSVFGTSKTTPTPTPTPSPSSKQEDVKAQAVPTTPAYTPAAAKTTEAAKPSSTKSHDLGNIISDLGQLFDEATSLLKGIGCVWADSPQASTKAQLTRTSGGDMWWGTDSAWQTTFINDASEDIVLACWSKDGNNGSFLKTVTPQIAVKIPSGQQQTVSHLPGVGGACTAAYPSTEFTEWGQLKQTLYEFTYGNSGTFDVSKEIYMHGNAMTAKGSKCTSDENTCVFKCKDGAVTCGGPDSYELINCSAANGGGGGWNNDAQGVGGGCAIGSNSEHVKVTLH